jgi:hypothetical protein
MLKKIILIIFRLWVGIVVMAMTTFIYKTFDFIKEIMISDSIFKCVIGNGLLFIALYILGLVIEKAIDVITGYKIIEEIKEN